MPLPFSIYPVHAPLSPLQAKLFGKNGLLIMAHGAGLSNAYALPQRSCVIEIYPRGMWCDLYVQMLAAMGVHVFPIYSTLLGPKVRGRVGLK